MEEIQKYNGNAELTTEDIKTLEAVGIIPKGTPPQQVKLFSRVCYEKSLSPFSKQIHLIARQDRKNNTTRYTHQTAIDGFRAIADRTGKYAGNDDYLFDNGETEYQCLELKKKKPSTATATIYKIVGGVRCPFSATARWDEYYPGGTMAFMWDKMPFLMLGKCAESLALRKAFPENLGGIYTNEEMMQAEVIQIEPEPKKTSSTKPAEVKTVNKDESAIPNPDELNPEILEKINTTKTLIALKNIWFELSDVDRGKYKENVNTRKAILKADKK